MMAFDWSLPDADCVRGLVLPLALTNSHDVGSGGGHTGRVPANINQTLVSLEKKSNLLCDTPRGVICCQSFYQEGFATPLGT